MNFSALFLLALVACQDMRTVTILTVYDPEVLQGATVSAEDAQGDRVARMRASALLDHPTDDDFVYFELAIPFDQHYPLTVCTTVRPIENDRDIYCFQEDGWIEAEALGQTMFTEVLDDDGCCWLIEPES